LWRNGHGVDFLPSSNFLSPATSRRTNVTTAAMAGPSDKARFYLEQSATELNELERKKIFTRVRNALVRTHCLHIANKLRTKSGR
jgi:hypothetical protein